MPLTLPLSRFLLILIGVFILGVYTSLSLFPKPEPEIRFVQKAESKKLGKTIKKETPVLTKGKPFILPNGTLATITNEVTTFWEESKLNKNFTSFPYQAKHLFSVIVYFKDYITTSYGYLYQYRVFEDIYVGIGYIQVPLASLTAGF